MHAFHECVSSYRSGNMKARWCKDGAVYFHTSMLPTIPALGQADRERYPMGQECTDQNWRGGGS